MFCFLFCFCFLFLFLFFCHTDNPLFSFITHCIIEGRPVARGCDPLPKSAKRSTIATEWAKNGVFVGGLRGWGSKSPLFGSKRSTFGGPTSPKSILATGLIEGFNLLMHVEELTWWNLEVSKFSFLRTCRLNQQKEEIPGYNGCLLKVLGPGLWYWAIEWAIRNYTHVFSFRSPGVGSLSGGHS